MFPIIFQFVSFFLQQTKNGFIYQYKRTINDERFEAFLQNLNQYD